MPRGVHHEHRIKSESDLERVWASYDDEGNELGFWVEVHGSQPEPNVETIKVKQGRPIVVSVGAGMAGAAIIQIAVHLVH